MSKWIARKRIGSRYGAATMVVLVGLLLAACSAKGKGTLAPYSPEAVDPLAPGVINEGRATFDFDLTCGVIENKPIVAGYFKYHDRGTTFVEERMQTFPAIKLQGQLVIEEVTLTDPVTGETTTITTDGNGCAAYEMLNNPAPESIAQFFGCYVADGKGSKSRSASVSTKDDDDDDYDNGVGCGKYASDDDDDECGDRATNDDDDDEDCSNPDPAREGRFNLLVFDQKLDSPVPGFTGDAFTLELVAGQYTGYTRAGYLKKGDIKVRNTQ